MGEAPDGAALVEELSERSARGGRDAGLLVMNKAAGVWRFNAMDSQGAAADGLHTTTCVACHREAPRDFVFVVPPPGQSVNAATNAAMTASAPKRVATDAATYDARSAGSADLPSSR